MEHESVRFSDDFIHYIIDNDLPTRLTIVNLDELLSSDEEVFELIDGEKPTVDYILLNSEVLTGQMIDYGINVWFNATNRFMYMDYIVKVKRGFVQHVGEVMNDPHCTMYHVPIYSRDRMLEVFEYLPHNHEERIIDHAWGVLELQGAVGTGIAIDIEDVGGEPAIVFRKHSYIGIATSILRTTGISLGASDLAGVVAEVLGDSGNVYLYACFDENRNFVEFDTVRSSTTEAIIRARDELDDRARTRPDAPAITFTDVYRHTGMGDMAYISTISSTVEIHRWRNTLPNDTVTLRDLAISEAEFVDLVRKIHMERQRDRDERRDDVERSSDSVSEAIDRMEEASRDVEVQSMRPSERVLSEYPVKAGFIDELLSELVHPGDDVSFVIDSDFYTDVFELCPERAVAPSASWVIMHLLRERCTDLREDERFTSEISVDESGLPLVTIARVIDIIDDGVPSHVRWTGEPRTPPERMPPIVPTVPEIRPWAEAFDRVYSYWYQIHPQIVGRFKTVVEGIVDDILYIFQGVQMDVGTVETGVHAVESKTLDIVALVYRQPLETPSAWALPEYILALLEEVKSEGLYGDRMLEDVIQTIRNNTQTYMDASRQGMAELPPGEHPATGLAEPAAVPAHDEVVDALMEIHGRTRPSLISSLIDIFDVLNITYSYEDGAYRETSDWDTHVPQRRIYLYSQTPNNTLTIAEPELLKPVFVMVHDVTATLEVSQWIAKPQISIEISKEPHSDTNIIGVFMGERDGSTSVVFIAGGLTDALKPDGNILLKPRLDADGSIIGYRTIVDLLQEGGT